ncbi:MAG: hypothetical protein H6707_05945 [Deltaproteobacteria bacterium]|nr:hypothetical protein [Deltaproteobacteria bacterium]
MSRTSLLILALYASTALVHRAAHANPEVVVIPLGGDDALILTTEVAAALVKQINKETPGRAALRYPVPSGGEPTTDGMQAAEQMQQAAKSFESLDFSAVQTTGGRALELYRRIALQTGETKGYVDALHLLAAASLFDGDAPRAQQLMNDAIVVDHRPPARKRFNPTVQNLHNSLLDDDKQPKGRLRFVVSPRALAWLNGKLLGPASGAITLRAGLYLVRVFRPGHTPVRRWFRVEPGQTQDLQVTLRPDPVAESGLIRALRNAAKQPTPGEAVRRALNTFDARELILLSSESEACRPDQCQLALAWAKDGRWSNRQNATHRGVAKQTTRTLLQQSEQLDAPQCATAADCGLNLHCVKGRCKGSTPFYKKWWFWTAVGAAAIGAGVGIGVAASSSGGAVIRVE